MSLQGPLSLLGRVLLATIFFMSGLHHGYDYVAKHTETVDGLRSNLPYPEILLPAAVVFLLAGSVSLIVGYHARRGAFLLLVFLALATFFFHNFWALEGKAAEAQMIHAMKNLAMMGAMLFIMGNGPGAWSIDHRREQAAMPA